MSDPVAEKCTRCLFHVKNMYDDICDACGGNGIELSHWVDKEDARKLVPNNDKLKPAPVQSAEEFAIKILDDLYCCTRVWSAWEYKTMSQDDFHFAAEDDNIVSDAMALIESRDAAQRQAGRKEMREILTEAMEAMDERRCYLDIWEWKYGERWDKEDAAIRKALSDLDKGATHE